MKAVVFIALGMATLLGVGCRTAKSVAASSFRVIDAPASFVRRHLDSDERTTTTTTVTSDNVTTPGRPVELAAERPPSRPQRVSADTRAGDRSTAATTSRSPSRAAANESIAPRSSATPAARSTANQSPQFPTARAVPGKPGYVFSPFDASGGYVDVTGYPSGSKAKDPYSQKVFIVP